MLVGAYKSASSEIFATCVPGFNRIWDFEHGRQILAAHEECKNRGVSTTRVFIFHHSRQIKSLEREIFEMHRSHGVDVRIFIDLLQPNFNFNANKISNDFAVIDNGSMIAVTEAIMVDINTEVKQAQWFIEDCLYAQKYLKKKRQLLAHSWPLDQLDTHLNTSKSNRRKRPRVPQKSIKQ
jgi:hypothetical protein